MVTQVYQPVQWELFVIRLTREAGSQGWRGQVIHLPDRQTHDFTSWNEASWDEVRRFINLFVPQEPTSPHAPGS